jgi:methylenetetrahydrofolate dehydrogenase (NADP+)/methenyltetrahydrofolate cyclohydrolase
MAILLKAAPLVLQKTEQMRAIVNKLLKKGITPSLKVVVVGDDPASKVYVEHKRKKCQEIGALAEIIKLPDGCNTELLIKTLNNLNSDPATNGIILQLPLPKHISFDPGLYIAPEKDVDGFTPASLYELYKGNTSSDYFIPCTPKGIVDLLNYYKIPLSGKKMTIVGRSQIVGRPMSLLALNLDASPTIVHSKTRNIKELCLKADIVVSAVGNPRFLTKDHFRNDHSQTVIDVGINRLADGTLAGDVDFHNVAPLVHSITPVPGGVGPMTVLSLMENLILATMRQHGTEKEKL